MMAGEKKIVVLTGSPRKNGNSNHLAASFIAAAERKGHTVTRLDAYHLQVDGCMACGQCYQKDGRACCFEDDFNKIAPLLLEAGAIVLATPLYWLSYPAKLQAIIDKWSALLSSGNTFEGKKGVLLATCGNQNPDVFQGLVYTYERSMKNMHCENAGEILVPGLWYMDDISKTDGESRAAALAEKLFDRE